MASSAYYNALKLQYSSKKSSLVEKKRQYVKYLEKLNDFSPILLQMIDLISDGNDNFSGGGYLIDEAGLSLDNGKLKWIINVLNNNDESLSNVITKTTNKINQISDEIVKYQNLYNEADINYKKAKEAEMSG